MVERTGSYGAVSGSGRADCTKYALAAMASDRRSMGAVAALCPMCDQSAAQIGPRTGATIRASAGVGALWFVVLRA